VEQGGQELNQRPDGCKSDVLTTTPPHACVGVIEMVIAVAVAVYLHEKSITINEYKEKYTINHANKVL